MSITRRQFVGGSFGGLFALAARHRCDELFAADVSKSTARCVVLWMGGGPSQLETFDPRPGTATGGPTKDIETSVAGVRIAENLPQIARRMNQLTILRGLTSPEGDHDRGSYFLHTGYPYLQAFLRPALGSIASHESEKSDQPQFVTIGTKGLGPAYLGPDHAPFAVEDPSEAVRLMTGLGRQRRSLRQLDEFNARFDGEHFDIGLQRRRTMLQRIERMLTTPFVKALDISLAGDADRTRYGDSEFGRRCLVARRLLESGVKFVEIHHDGWDTHSDNFNSVARLCGEIDHPWATLIDDLRASGLWEDTILVWMGEFGRTPRINGTNGRDHFPRITPVVVGGGAIQRGGVLGRTDKYGQEIESDEFTVPDLFATLLKAMRINPGLQFRNEFGAVAPVTDHGTVISQLLT
jgi:hypothetical protein